MFIGDIMRHVNIHGKHDYAGSGLENHHLWEYPDRMNIRAIRRARGLTQIQLSELSDLGQSTVSRAEKGDDGVTLGNFKSIAAALNVRLSDLFADGRTAAEQAVIEAYRHLPPDRQKGWQDALGIAASDQA